MGKHTYSDECAETAELATHQVWIMNDTSTKNVRLAHVCAANNDEALAKAEERLLPGEFIRFLFEVRRRR